MAGDHFVEEVLEINRNMYVKKKMEREDMQRGKVKSEEAKTGLANLQTDVNNTNTVHSRCA